MKQIIVLLSLVLVIHFSHAQSTELGLIAGVSSYSGDLSQDEFGLYFENLKPAFGVFGRLNLNKTLALRLGVSHGQVQEESELRNGPTYKRNFRSSITEFALTGELNLFRLESAGGTQIMPYVFGGAAIFNFRPEAKFDGNWVELQPLGTEGQGLPGYEAPYRLTQVALPMGLGLKIVFDNWTLGFELGGRKLFTDYLDDISSQVVSFRDILEGNGELAATISEPRIDISAGELNTSYTRGGPYQDWYYISGMTLSFDIGGGSGGSGRKNSGRNIGCPTF